MAARDVFSYLGNRKFSHLNLQVSASFFEIYSGKVGLYLLTYLILIEFVF